MQRQEVGGPKYHKYCDTFCSYLLRQASQLFQEVTQLCGTIMSNDLVASEAEKQHAQGSVIDNKGENRTLLS